MNAPREAVDLSAESVQGLSLVELLQKTEALQKQGQLKLAAEQYSQWLEGSQDPLRYAALFNLASIQQQIGEYPAAEKSFQEALALHPAFGQAHINLGLMYERMGLKNKALQQWNAFASQRFLSSKLDQELLCTALNHIGRLQENEKAYDLAEQALRESLRIKPEQPGVVQHWIHIRQKACMWPVYEPLPGLSMARLMRYTSPLGMLALTDDPAVQLLTSQNFVQRMYSSERDRLTRKDRVSDGRRKVGIVSADLREHAVGFLLPMFLKGRDREAYELYAYDFTKEERTALRDELKRSFDHFIDISALSDRQAAERMAADGIDILIDLHGLSAHARPGIFALRPAPLQGTYLGFIGPTGMPWLDFVIADKDVIPPELALYFTEAPVPLDGSFIPLDQRQVALPKVTRADLGLPADAFLMAAFGNVYKITPEMFVVWMNVLHRLPQAILCLIDDNPVTVSNLRIAAQRAGIDPNRVRFLPRVEHPMFCARLRLFDVFLDTYPYNCGSTSSDVVNAGVPMVSRWGRTMVSRMGLSILRQCGQEDLTVPSFAAYEDKVVEIALRRQARPDRRFATRVGSMFNQAMERVLRIHHDPVAHEGGQTVATPGTSTQKIRSTTRPSLSLFLHPLDLQTQRGQPARSVIDQEPPDGRTHLQHVRHYLLNRPLGEDGLYGFFTDEGLAQIGLNHRHLENAVLQHGPDTDILLCSPWWDLSALSLNPFLLAEVRHPGIAAAAQQLVHELGLEKTLAAWAACTESSLQGLHFVARRRVWLRWIEMADRLVNHASPIIQSHRDTLYQLLGNLLIIDGRYQVDALGAFSQPPWDPTAESQRRRALTCNALKGVYARTGDRAYLDEYVRLVKQAGSDCASP